MTWRTRLRVERAGYDLSGRAVWELLEPLVYESPQFGTIIVPPTFRTNYASVPRAPFVYLYAGDVSFEEACVHDYEYTVHRRTREEADAIFLEALLANPMIGDRRAWAMHKAVRWFGASSWSDETNIMQTPEISALVRR